MFRELATQTFNVIDRFVKDIEHVKFHPLLCVGGSDVASDLQRYLNTNMNEIFFFKKLFLKVERQTPNKSSKNINS